MDLSSSKIVLAALLELGGAGEFVIAKVTCSVLTTALFVSVDVV